MEEGGEERSGEKGKDNTETKKEEEKKGGGEKGGMAPGRRGNEAENTHKGNGKPKDRDRKDGKEQQEEREFGTKDTQGKYRACVRRRTQKRDKREGAKAVKKEEVPRQERRIQLDRRRTQGKYRRRIGATERIGTEKWLGRKGLQKGEDTGTEGTHRESTEDAQEATHENTSYILRWKQGRQGKDGAPTG